MEIAFAFLIGVVAGLRTVTAPAVVSWGVFFGWLPVGETWAAFLGARYTPWVFSALALVEFVLDQLPATPSRRTPPQFAARIASGGVVAGLLAGVAGAVAGTLGGAAARARLARAFGGRDRPAALLEDAVAVGLGLLTVAAVA